MRRIQSLQIARSLLIAVSWVLAVAALVPAILVHDLIFGMTGFIAALFFLGFAISPMWTATMDIATKKTAAGRVFISESEDAFWPLRVHGAVAPLRFPRWIGETNSHSESRSTRSLDSNRFRRVASVSGLAPYFDLQQLIHLPERS